jgi:hypothetical protein
LSQHRDKRISTALFAYNNGYTKLCITFSSYIIFFDKIESFLFFNNTKLHLHESEVRRYFSIDFHSPWEAREKSAKKKMHHVLTWGTHSRPLSFLKFFHIPPTPPSPTRLVHSIPSGSVVVFVYLQLLSSISYSNLFQFNFGYRF